MRTPLVSICLPSLNTFPFLQERIDSILGQTFGDWELVVIDSHSEDGSWEFFERLARGDRRVSIFQAPKGLYSSWNRCLQLARGQFVYVATSDDTMALDCLEKLLAALEAQPDCDLAHCPLVMTDRNGAKSQGTNWPECTTFAHGIGELASRPHIRRAPYDGLLHLMGSHVILAVNQLLIRRSLFERTGYFQPDWGSIGDFNWEMKAGLLASMVHVPDTWTSWRLHEGQATSFDLFSPERTHKIEAMIQQAISACATQLPAAVQEDLRDSWLARSRDLRLYYAELHARHGAGSRRLFQLQQMLTGTRFVRSEMLARARGAVRWLESGPARIRSWLEGVVGRPVVEALPPARNHARSSA